MQSEVLRDSRCMHLLCNNNCVHATCTVNDRGEVACLRPIMLRSQAVAPPLLLALALFATFTSFGRLLVTVPSVA